MLSHSSRPCITKLRAEFSLAGKALGGVKEEGKSGHEEGTVGTMERQERRRRRCSQQDGPKEDGKRGEEEGTVGAATTVTLAAGCRFLLVPPLPTPPSFGPSCIAVAAVPTVTS